MKTILTNYYKEEIKSLDKFPNRKTPLKAYYLYEHTDDKLGIKINDSIAFYDLFLYLDNKNYYSVVYDSVYDLIGVDDSLVRERLFEGLCKVMGCSYDEIYEQWMNYKPNTVTNG